MVKFMVVDKEHAHFSVVTYDSIQLDTGLQLVPLTLMLILGYNDMHLIQYKPTHSQPCQLNV